MKKPGSKIALLIVTFLILLSGHSSAEEKTPIIKNPGPLTAATLGIIRRARLINVYKYRETLEPGDPRRNYLVLRRVIDNDLGDNFKRLLTANATYQPQYKKRCMPVWDYGIEFSASDQSRLVLFSFRCNTMKIVEEHVFRDFQRQRTELYALLKYELNDFTTELIDSKK